MPSENLPTDDLEPDGLEPDGLEPDELEPDKLEPDGLELCWVQVCQGPSCCKAGAAAVLAAFQANPAIAAQVVPVSCRGQCGNGPMVIVLPQGVWYWRVQATEVAAVIQRHLRQGQPIVAMLYPVMHPPG